MVTPPGTDIQVWKMSNLTGTHNPVNSCRSSYTGVDTPVGTCIPVKYPFRSPYPWRNGHCNTCQCQCQGDLDTNPIYLRWFEKPLRLLSFYLRFSIQNCIWQLQNETECVIYAMKYFRQIFPHLTLMKSHSTSNLSRLVVRRAALANFFPFQQLISRLQSRRHHQSSRPSLCPRPHTIVLPAKATRRPPLLRRATTFLGSKLGYMIHVIGTRVEWGPPRADVFLPRVWDSYCRHWTINWCIRKHNNWKVTLSIACECISFQIITLFQLDLLINNTKYPVFTKRDFWLDANIFQEVKNSFFPYTLENVSFSFCPFPLQVFHLLRETDPCRAQERGRRLLPGGLQPESPCWLLNNTCVLLKNCHADNYNANCTSCKVRFTKLHTNF